MLSEKELRTLEDLGGLKLVKRTSTMSCIPFIKVLTRTVNNVIGESQESATGRGYLEVDGPDNVYSPASGATDVRLFIIAMKALDSYAMLGDYLSAYLNGCLNKKVYLFLPNGHPQRDSSLYGLSVAGSG